MLTSDMTPGIGSGWMIWASRWRSIEERHAREDEMHDFQQRFDAMDLTGPSRKRGDLKKCVKMNGTAFKIRRSLAKDVC